jgi:7-cyano-7-deazaguanine synthase
MMARAVVLLSGGLDSATVLALAQERGFDCYTLSFDYGQRHRAELEAAETISQQANTVEHRVMEIPIGAIGGSALTDEAIAVPDDGGSGIPVTYVPARNTVFDYSGYPDCRPEFIEAFSALAALATKQGVEGSAVSIEAPLVAMTKSDIIRAGVAAGVDYALTVSCYRADDDGRACGHCDACRFRRDGFEAAGLSDPTRYQI